MLTGGLRGEDFVHGGEHLFGMDGQQPGFRRCVAGMVAAAFRAAQHFVAGSIGSVAAGVRGAMDRRRAGQCAGQVQRAGIAANHQGHAAGKRDQLVQRALDGDSIGCSLKDGLGERFFAGAYVDEYSDAPAAKFPGHLCIPFGRPPFGAPPGARVDEN